MIGYITLGTNDFDRACAFYDALLGDFGARRTMEFPPRFVAWGKSPTSTALAVCKPYNGKEATIGNGSMAALHCTERETVDRLYAKAIELGGTDEGPPGERAPGFYAAYFRDLDGNKLAFFQTG